MATGLGETFRSNVLNYIIRGAAAPAHQASLFISLHTADPGNDGGAASSNEVTGGSYVRFTLTSSTGWTSPSAATPYSLTNSGTITFVTASANWGTLTHFGVWTSSSLQTGAAYIGRGTLQGAGVTVNNGQTLSFATGQLSMSITTTLSGTTGMGQTFRKTLYDYLLASGTGGTDPMASISNIFVSLHTGDPGVDGASNEASGGSYARKSTTRGTSPEWTGAASVATPAVITNGGAVTFVQATGSWGTCTFFGMYKTLAGVTAADFILKGTITSQAITNGNIPSFAASQLSTDITQT